MRAFARSTWPSRSPNLAPNLVKAAVEGRLPRGIGVIGRGSLFYLLRNRFYIGEVKYKNEILPGEQPALMDRALFDAVQQKLTDQWTNRTTMRNASDHLLTGLLFDDAGHRMVPTHATKAGVRYRYYVSLPHLHGESKTASVGSVFRIPATETCPAASASSGSAIRRPNGFGSLTRSDSIRNSISPGPRSRITAAPNPEYGFNRVRTSALNHGRRERNFWMQRQGAKSRHQNARTPTETRIRDLSRRECPQKRPI